MMLEIPNEDVQNLLSGLRRHTRASSTYVADRIQKVLDDTEAVDRAMQSPDLTELYALAETVEPGFNRMRVLHKIYQIEKPEDWEE